MATILFNAMLGALLVFGTLHWGGDQAHFPLRVNPLRRLRGWDNLGAQAAKWRRTWPGARLLTTVGAAEADAVIKRP